MQQLCIVWGHQLRCAIFLAGTLCIVAKDIMKEIIINTINTDVYIVTSMLTFGALMVKDN